MPKVTKTVETTTVFQCGNLYFTIHREGDICISNGGIICWVYAGTEVIQFTDTMRAYLAHIDAEAANA